MILIQLDLTNFRRYERLSISFKDGITGIVGKNGTGKSTLLEAILWCLYGNRAARTGKDGIKRQAADPGETCEVSLNFQLNGIEYRLTRSLIGKSNRTETKLTQHGQLDAVTTREVDDYIIRLIGLNLKGFLSSFFARQKELNALTDARPAERRNHLARMLGVGRLDNAIEALKNDIKMTRKEIDVLETSRVNIDEQQKLITSGLESVATLEKTIFDQLPLRKGIEDDISLWNKTLQHVLEKQAKFTSIEKQIIEISGKKEAAEAEVRRLSGEIQSIEQELPRLEELKEESNAVERLETEVKKLIENRAKVKEQTQIQTEISTVKNKHDIILTGIDALRHEVERLRGEASQGKAITERLDSLRKSREKLLEEHRKVDSPIPGLEKDIAKLKRQKEQIQELGPDAACEYCLRSFGEDFANIEAHFTQELLSLEERLKPLLAERNRIASEGKAVAEQIREYEVKNKQINKIESELAAATTRLSGLETSLNEAKQLAADLEKRLAAIGDVSFSAEELNRLEGDLKAQKERREQFIRLKERSSRLPDLRQRFEVKNNDINILSSELATKEQEKQAVGYQPNEYSEVQQKLNSLNRQLSESKLTIERLTSEKKLMEKDIALARERIAEAERSIQRIAGLHQSLQYQEKLSLLFADFRTFLIGRIRPALSRQTSQLFHEMTAGRYQEVELDEDYNLCLYDNGEQFSIDRFSGGEIDLANLCFRLAISLEMASTAGIENSFIILDEIFGSQDRERQYLIMEGLSRLKNRFRQIIIVSHIDDVKELSEHIIEVELAGEGASHITIADKE
ncbi:MAG: SMC family ATPase [Candidatus Zixiibacteriota bacterium]